MASLRWLWRLYLAILLAGRGVGAMEVDVNDPASVKSTAKFIAADMMKMYEYNIDKTGIIGKLIGTWWVAGGMFMTMIQYWYLTGDATWNSDVTDGMLAQKGEFNDYFPANWSAWLGNDDQVFWGLAAMTAAELNYPERPGQPSWVALAQGVFNSQAPRWDDTACGGGMRWQCFPYQEGYTLKNSVSNGGLFQLSARLYYYTNNHTYYEWANKIYDWSAAIGLIDESTWAVEDSVSNENNCSTTGNAQWSYNYGMYFYGSAYMYSSSGGKEGIWLTRVNGILATVYREFFPAKYGGDIMSEYYCEIPNNCDGNSSTFKAFLSAWLAFLTTLVPIDPNVIMAKLKASAVGAAQQCSGGDDGKICGMHWYESTWDGDTGIGEQMSALSVLSSTLIEVKKGGATPKTRETGGLSKPDPNAGTGGNSGELEMLPPVTTADRAGAGIVTAVFVISWVAGVVWMLYDR